MVDHCFCIELLQGYLVASHLSRDDMVDVFLLNQANQVLPLTRLHPVRQIVSWSEIHPTKDNNSYIY